jgi:hypothetical protein
MAVDVPSVIAAIAAIQARWEDFRLQYYWRPARNVSEPVIIIGITYCPSLGQI